MKKEQFNSWLQRKVETQAKITMAACASMAVLGLLAFLIQGGLLYLLFSAAYGSRFLGSVIVLGLFGGMGAFTVLTAPKQLRDAQHEISDGAKEVDIRIAPTLSNAWTFAMGSLESDQSIPQRIISLMMLVPRLLWTSYFVFGRITEVKNVHVDDCSKVLRMILKRDERIEASEVAEKYTDMDVPRILRELSLIDGVVFLTKESVGLSVAKRFKDAVENAFFSEGSTSPASPFNSTE